MKRIEKLNMYSKNITSQHGEDGIVSYILERVGDIPKSCVDIGAWDGKNLSNVYSLWHDKGWSAVLIEANKNRSDQISKNYKEFNIKAFNLLVKPKGENSIDQLFKVNKLDPEIGIISIDIDSFDYYVWKYMEYVKPRIVIIEHNHTIPGYIDYHDPEDIVFLRCSAKSLEKLGAGKGFKLICCTLTNSIFIREELFNEEFFPDYPVEYLFNYSSCSGVKVSGFVTGNPYRNLDVHYGFPSRIERYAGLLKKAVNLLLLRYKKPPKEVEEYCSRNGINIL